MSEKEKSTSSRKIFISVMAVFCVILLSAVLLSCVADRDNSSGTDTSQSPIDGIGTSVMPSENAVSESDDAVRKPETEGTVAPTEPLFSGFGTAESSGELGWLLDAASALLNGQDTLFTTETPILEGTQINYYLDSTLFAVCWQQVIDNMIYTIAEVKVADASQFRRYMSDNDVQSRNLCTTTQLSEQCGALIAGSGDYFQSREAGIVVYDGICERCYGAKQMDTCFVDVNGDLILAPKGTFEHKEDVQQFVDEHNISFGFSFGPILVDEGVQCEPSIYGLGEPTGYYGRAAICQRDDLHYLMVVVNGSNTYRNYPNIHMFAEQIASLGCEKAYALDGGQTAAIAMNHQLMNPTEYTNGQRRITDIYCFFSGLSDSAVVTDTTLPDQSAEATEAAE